LIRERVPLIHRVQQRWEDANSKLAAVASAMMGVSGRAILAALLAGHTAPPTWAELATGRRRSTREPLAHALEGRVNPPHRVGLTALWCQIDGLDDTIARLKAQLQALCGPCEEAVGVLDTIPGLARQTAERLVAAIGTDRRRFPRADHVASWAGVAPGHDERAGTRASGKTRQGNRCLRTTWVQAAHVAARTTGTSLSAPYRRLAARRGKKRAILARAHSMRMRAYDRIQRQEPYRDVGADFFDRLQPEDTARRLITRLEGLGYQVTLKNPATEAML
jgi:transposase